ncbi:MAG: fatty acid desaturase [Planctomycetes bacterium]|nr:fatty acid desaturase [Planctomycetota bacterium]
MSDASAIATPPPAPVLAEAAPPPRPAASAPAIRWYRTPIEREAMKQVLKKSDLLAALQTGGFLATITATGATVICAYAAGLWWAILPLLFLHGMVMSFLINGVHELRHETVFTNRRVNRFFAALLAFPGWINHHHFAESHGRHHRYTMHPPADLEVTLPVTIRWRDFWRQGFCNLSWPAWSVQGTWNTARGRFDGDWNRAIFPESDPGKRRPVVRWAWTLLIGHGVILAVSLAMHWWIVPLVVSFAPIFGAWLFWLCNNTQHVGLQDNVADARLCCRTIVINPIARFLYWHMNFHTEHHMFAAAPCYRLGKLHRLMRDDLPPCPVGLVATWTHIMEVMRKQAADASYRHVASLPAARAVAVAAPTT